MVYKLLVLLLTALLTSPSNSAEADLSCTAPTQNEDGSPLTDLTNYEWFYGCTISGAYSDSEITPATICAHTVTELPDAGTCYFAAKATNSKGESSVFSNEASKAMGSLEVPGPIVDTAITWQESGPVMAITYVGGDNDNKGSSAPLEITLPAHQTDDFGIIIAFAQNDTPVMAVATAPGWSELRNDVNTTGADYRTYIFYKKFTSGSETNPTVTTNESIGRAGLLVVFRGVDTATPFDVTEQYVHRNNDSTPTPAAITPVTANGALILYMGYTHDQINSFAVSATPAGLTLGPSDLDTGNLVAAAYLEDYGAASTITPTAWTNDVSGSSGESPNYTIALRPVAAGGPAAAVFGHNQFHNTLN